MPVLREMICSKYGSITKQDTCSGNPGLCPQLWPCWHHGRFPWSSSLAVNLVETQVLSDLLKSLCHPHSSILPQHSASGRYIALVSLFSPVKEHHLLGKVSGDFVWTFLKLNANCGYIFGSERDRNSGLWHSASAR